MDDYIRRNEAIDVLATMQGSCTSKAALVQNSKIWKQIKNLPSLDAVEVVRCKDCRLSEHDIGITEYWCCYWDNKTLENGYCSYGERKV